MKTKKQNGTASKAAAEVPPIPNFRAQDSPVADYYSHCPECGKKISINRSVASACPSCVEDSRRREVSAAVAEEKAETAVRATQKIKDRILLNATDGVRRCLNPFCDRIVTGRRNKKCCDAACANRFGRYKETSQIKVAEDKEAKLIRKSSDEAADLRPSQAIEYRPPAVRSTVVNFLDKNRKKHIVIRKIDYGTEASRVKNKNGDIVTLLPPKYRIGKESIQTIPLSQFYSSPARRLKEEAKETKRREKRMLDTKFAEAMYLFNEKKKDASPYVPTVGLIGLAEKPLGNASHLAVPSSESPSCDAGGAVTFVNKKPLPKHEAMLLPTTGRDGLPVEVADKPVEKEETVITTRPTAKPKNQKNIRPRKKSRIIFKRDAE